MNRLLVFALVASIGNVSAALAGESILTSGTRHVQELAVSVSDAATAAAAPATMPLPTRTPATVPPPAAPAY